MFEKEAIHERQEFNKELYKKIFKITKKPKKILDLGCGLNPIYFPYKNIEYIAVDTNKQALKKVKKHFKKNKISGKVLNLNITSPSIKKIKDIDIVFSFKVLDALPRKSVKNLLQNIQTKWFIVSFPTRTVSGKRMQKPRRKWFESISKIHKIIRFHNEIFYIIKK